MKIILPPTLRLPQTQDVSERSDSARFGAGLVFYNHPSILAKR